jgi:hypothetical protein
MAFEPTDMSSAGRSKQERIDALIAEYPDLSANALGRIAEVDPKTIRVFREKLAV